MLGEFLGIGMLGEFLGRMGVQDLLVGCVVQHFGDSFSWPEITITTQFQSRKAEPADKQRYRKSY